MTANDASATAAETTAEQQPAFGRRLLRWGLRGLAGLFALVFVAAAAGFIYQQIAVARDRALSVPSGRLVSLADHALHVDCKGHGSPVVVLEAGLGVTGDSWDWVQRDLSSLTQVCSYDRAGIGYSSAASADRSARSSADDLGRLLAAMGIDEPVVLAGHSYGGLVSRVFAHAYPRKVAGLIFVDSAHEDMGERFPGPVKSAFRQLLGSFTVLADLDFVGAPRFLGVPDQMSAGLDGPAKQRAVALLGTRAQMEGAAAEAALWDRSAEQAREVHSLGALPLTVIVAGGWPDIMRPSWLSMQKELAAKSSNHRLVIVAGADHPGLLQRPQYARIVANEIARVVTSLRR